MTALLGLLGACNIDSLAAEFHVVEPTTGTSGTGSSSAAGEANSSDSSASGKSTGIDGSTSTLSSTSAEPESTSDAGSTTGAPPAVCGDGSMDDGEECDDGNTVDTDECDNTCARSWTIFVTSQTMYTGKLNGLEGADNRCRNAALNAPLPRGLQYTALISDSTTDAAERVHHARGWYRLVNGLPVAHGWDELMTGPLLNPVNVSEKSETNNTSVWTGTAPGGIAVPGAEHCSDWTLESAVITGHFGRSTDVDSNWLYWSWDETNPTICYAPRALYCIEQP